MSFKTAGLVVAIGLGFLAARVAAAAQPAGKVPRIGLLRVWSPPDPLVDAFGQALRGLGHTEGQTIAIEYRYAEGKPDRLPALAAELVGLKVDVIVAQGSVAVRAAQQATSTIPIVMAAAGDPVAAGFVASLARPGGNITGLVNFGPELAAKRLDVLKEAAPAVSRVAVVSNPGNPAHPLEWQAAQEAAQALGVALLPLTVGAPQAIEPAFKTMARQRAAGLMFLPDALYSSHRTQIVGLAARRRLPAIYDQRAYVDAGGLMAYGPSYADLYRRAAAYVDKILKGAKPADLPVEQPTRIEFVVNLKAANTLGLTIPRSILMRADQVIQ
jgi:putative ABC transport system substrate-binding protein